MLGSPAAVVQVIVAEPPDERFVGALSVRAEMRGTTRIKALLNVQVNPGFQTDNYILTQVRRTC